MTTVKILLVRRFNATAPSDVIDSDLLAVVPPLCPVHLRRQHLLTSDANRSIFTIASNPLALTSHSSTKCALLTPRFRSYVGSFDFIYLFYLTSPTNSEPPLWSVVHRSFHCIFVHACVPCDPSDGVLHTQAHPGTHAYFKSTDGHHGNWSFNLRRPNLHLLPVVVAHGGHVRCTSSYDYI
jgi:hypothetical protein